MEYRRFGDTIVARLDRGEEILEQVERITRQEKLQLASVQALGAVDSFTVGCTIRRKRHTVPTTLREAMRLFR